MDDGAVLQSKESSIQHQAELHGFVLSLDAGTMANSEGVSERMVNERRSSSESTNKPCAIRPQELTKRNSRELAVHFEESGESDEETGPSEAPLTTSLMDLSVLERLGLHRVAMTEQDVEAAFAHLSLAFRCDMFTMKRRVQVEERARNTAEENIQQELEECHATIQKLDQACLDTRLKALVEQLRNSLRVLAGAVERATVAAEKLGAVHQEARMSRAAEVMVQHVENLKRYHMREHTELEEMKRLIQQNSRNRQLAENRDDGEQRLKLPSMRMFQQGSARRRVSIAVIPRQLMPFHSPENGQGFEGEASKSASSEEVALERQSHCLQQDSADNYCSLPIVSASSSHQSLQRANSIEEVKDRSHSMEGLGELSRRESDLRSRSSISKTVEEQPEEDSDNEGLNAECAEFEEKVLTSKVSKIELCRVWFSMPTYYWVLLWLFFMGIACLVLIRILELQKQYPFPTSDS